MNVHERKLMRNMEIDEDHRARLVDRHNLQISAINSVCERRYKLDHYGGSARKVLIFGKIT